MSYDEIFPLIDMGKGFAAQELGVPHDVYRLTDPDSDGSVLTQTNLISAQVKVFTRIAYGASIRTSFEGEKQQGILWYEIVADMRPFLVGDIFVLNDPVYGQGYSSVNFATEDFKGFALADHSPIKKTLGGRLNTFVKIFRLSKTPDPNTKDWNNTRKNSLPVTLSSGTFSLGAASDTPTLIPAGLMSTGKSYGDRIFDQKPGDQRKSGWELYIPALNGFQIREGDRIEAMDGSRYVVIVPYTQYVGATGSQWFLEREVPGPG